MKNCAACKTEDEYCFHNVEEKLGLECVESFDDPQASYTFDEFKIWRRNSDGALFWATDSGCSCPTPFEDVKTIEDLHPITPNSWEDFKTRFEAYGTNGDKPYDNYRYIEAHIVVETLDKIRAMLYRRERA